MQHAFAWRRAMLASLALVPAVALGVAPTRAADSGVDTRQMAVHYHDLDLATAKGRTHLEMRLQRAAAMVCGNPDGERPAFNDEAARTCYNSALAHAHTALATAQARREVVTR